MSVPIIWQPDSIDPQTRENLALITQWWESLNSQEIFWQQRLISDDENWETIDWENQQFDEKFALAMPQIRGITLYWQKPGESDERSITPRKLELDTNQQYLYIYPKSQPKLVIRLSKPPLYETWELKDPLIVGTSVGNNYVLLLRDKQQKLEIKLNLSPESLRQLLENLESRNKG